ncbi:MAG TPA: type II toxin-antitoxin system VapC family toxin [Verrucomicrobiae bacterium]|nr:type II toxin-antitoxin system VapC family toxin [Verrucomicrobiae bacterium]
MKLLLDTHIWIWSFLEPGKLVPRAARALQDPNNEKWLSPISIWELVILVAKRRVVLNTSVEEWISQALKAAPIREAPLTAEVALATSKISLPHRDPADAFLAATALTFGLTLVTSDVRLLSVKGLTAVANR